MNKFAFPLLAIFAALGLYFMYIQPKLDEIAILDEQKFRFELQVAEAREVQERIAQLEADFAAIDPDDLARMEYILPKEFDTARTIANIENIVEENNGDLIAISLGDSVGGKSADEFLSHDISFGISAPYTSFLSILDEIETSLQFSNITKIEIGGSSDGKQGEVTAPYSVTLTFYQAK